MVGEFLAWPCVPAMLRNEPSVPECQGLAGCLKLFTHADKTRRGHPLISEVYLKK